MDYHFGLLPLKFRNHLEHLLQVIVLQLVLLTQLAHHCLLMRHLSHIFIDSTDHFSDVRVLVLTPDLIFLVQFVGNVILALVGLFLAHLKHVIEVPILLRDR